MMARSSPSMAISFRRSGILSSIGRCGPASGVPG
jgi:hypothetical protein